MGHGRAGLAVAWHGRAWHGMVGHDMALQGMQGMAHMAGSYHSYESSFSLFYHSLICVLELLYQGLDKSVSLLTNRGSTQIVLVLFLSFDKDFLLDQTTLKVGPIIGPTFKGVWSNKKS